MGMIGALAESDVEPDSMNRGVFLGIALLLAVGSQAWADTVPTQPDISSSSERIFANARPRLLQVRTLLKSADQQSSLGSAFLVAADGLAITNYHVVSQYALEPDTYRMEYLGADGSHGGLQLLAVDVADDLAVVRLDHQTPDFFSFDATALADQLPRGEKFYALGNPLDLGFTIVDGTYNGQVQRSYQPRIHFTGALNPGMSGGPALTEAGEVVGVNVSRQIGSELVSFLVPARFAAALLTKAQALKETPAPTSFRAEIGRQLVAWQDGLYQAVIAAGFKPVETGPYAAPESAAPWFTCWARTNREAVPKPLADDDMTQCATNSALFVANDLTLGSIYLLHSHISSTELNPFRFAAFVGQNSVPVIGGNYSRKSYTRQQCREDFIEADPLGTHPPLRAVWCSRAYREFDGLYDVSLQLMTEDRSTETLVAHLFLQGVSYDNAESLGKLFIGALTWRK